MKSEVPATRHTMKRKIGIVLSALLLVGAIALPTNANALAINCGCRKLKKALSLDGYSLEDAEIVAKCHGGFQIKICINF